MSALERVDAAAWGTRVDTALDAARSPLVDEAQAATADYTTTKRATLEQYTAWYEGELLPEHDQTWKLAVDALVTYGHELRHTDQIDQIKHHHISTGLLVLDGVQYIGNDAVAPALRINTFTGTANTFKVRRALKKAQQPEATAAQHAEAHGILDGVTRQTNIEAETFMVSTSGARLSNPREGSFQVREIAYPRSWQERARHNGYNDGSKKHVRQALEDPDVCVNAQLLHVLFDPINKHISSTAILAEPEIYMSSRLPNIAVSPHSFDEIIADARQHQRPVATLGDMLLRVAAPLGDFEAFKPAPVIE